jgi:hypothetical protein
VRLRSDIWVKAYLRRAAGDGCPGAVLHHGDDMAGAIFIQIASRDRTVTLFGPAPAGYGDGDEERRFMAILPAGSAEETAKAKMESERRFDSDLWLIEIESPDGRHYLESWLLATRP